MEKAKNRYHHESGEEQAKSYPEYNVERFHSKNKFKINTERYLMEKTI